MDKSKYNMSYANTSLISRINELHLIPGSAHVKQKLFRDANELSLNYITKELLDTLVNSDVTGIRAIEAEGWDGNELTRIGNILT